MDLIPLAPGFEFKNRQDRETSGNDQANANQPRFLAGDRATNSQQEKSNRNGGVPPCHPAKARKPHAPISAQRIEI